jgi:hypothetical protein
MITFGRIPRRKSAVRFEPGLSEDKRALTLTFSDFQIHVGGGKSRATTVTRLFSLPLPLRGDESNVEIEFNLDCLAITTAGATASLVCSVNGQTTVADFPENTDQSFIHTLRFAAETPSEARLCVFLLLGRNSKNPDAEANLSVSSLEAELLPRPPGPA